MIVFLIVLIAVIGISGYFFVRLDEEHPALNPLLFVFIVSGLMTPSHILFIAFDYFNVEGLNIIPVSLQFLLAGLLVIWATWGASSRGNGATDKKDDLVTDAIILTAVLSNNESKSDSSNNSNSSGSSSSNSDDFFLL